MQAAEEVVPDNTVDMANKYVSSKWRLFNRDVDSFFTNQNYRVTDNKSSILAYSTFYKKEGQKMDNDFDFQIKIDLPRTTKKLKLVIEKEQDEIRNALSDENLPKSRSTSNGKKGKKINNDRTNTKSSKYSAGVNYLLSQSDYFTSLIQFGLRLDVPINPSIKLNLEKEIKTKYINIALAQKLILYRQEGFQEISQVLFSRNWNKKIQTDFLNSLVWSHETDDLVLRNNFILYYQVGEEKIFSYSVGANAKFDPGFYYDSYDTSVSYRQLVYNKWLYGTLTLGMDFPKVSHYKSEKFVQLRMEVFFR